MTDAAWYPDPTSRHELRYYDGTGWTDHVSDAGATSADPVDVVEAAEEKGPGRIARARNKAQEINANAAAVGERIADRAAGELPEGALYVTISHDSGGRNAKVVLYPDRIERVKERARSSLSKAKQDTEVIPIRSVSSVQAKKDGISLTKVTVFASGNNIEFRIPHAQAGRFKDAVMERVLGVSAPAAAAVTAPDVADQLRKLAGLRDDGILSSEEFDAQKAKLLGL